MPDEGGCERDLDRALTTIKLLAGCFSDLASAFAATDREAAERAIAPLDKGAAEVLRNVWGECAREVDCIRDIDALLKQITERAIDRMPQAREDLERELAENRRMIDEFNGLAMKPNATVAAGTQRLLKQGRIVWSGPLGSPIEDAECDEIELNPEDYRQLIETRPRRL